MVFLLLLWLADIAALSPKLKPWHGAAVEVCMTADNHVSPACDQARSARWIEYSDTVSYTHTRSAKTHIQEIFKNRMCSYAPPMFLCMNQSGLLFMGLVSSAPAEGVA